MFSTCKPKSATCMQPEELTPTKCLLCHVAGGTLLLEMHKVFHCTVVPLPKGEELAATCPLPTRKSSPCSLQHNCSDKQALITHIMHNIIRVSLSAGKQLHPWIRTLSKLGGPNYTSRQLFADLPKTIWWSHPVLHRQVSASQQTSASFALLTGWLANSAGKLGLPLPGLFHPLGPRADPPQAGGTDRECLEWQSAPSQRPKGEYEFPTISV